MLFLICMYTHTYMFITAWLTSRDTVYICVEWQLSTRLSKRMKNEIAVLGGLLFGDSCPDNRFQMSYFSTKPFSFHMFNTAVTSACQIPSSILSRLGGLLLMLRGSEGTERPPLCSQENY